MQSKIRHSREEWHKKEYCLVFSAIKLINFSVDHEKKNEQSNKLKEYENPF